MVTRNILRIAQSISHVQWRKLAGVCFSFALLAALSPAAVFGARGGLPGTGDRYFDPAHHAEGNHCLTPDGIDANEVLGVSRN